jgi:hypothetical protein
MDINEFQNLSDNEKADYLWYKGKPVGTYDRENARFILYQVDGFYVEAEYKTDFMEIRVLKALETNDIPAIYIDHLNIPGPGN